MPESVHVGERLSAYLDDELEPKVRAAVAAHLAACATCAGELEELRLLQAQLLETAVPDPGTAYWSSFTNRVQARLPTAGASAPSSWLERLSSWFLPSGGLGWVRLAGALATVTLVAYLGMRGFRPESAGRIEPLQQGRDVALAPSPAPAAPAEKAQDTQSQDAVEPIEAHRDAAEPAKEKRSAENALAEERATETGRVENPLAKREASGRSAVKQEFSQEPPAAASPSAPAPAAVGALGRRQRLVAPESGSGGAPATSAAPSRSEAPGKFASKPTGEPQPAGVQAQKSSPEAASEPAKDLASPSPAALGREVESSSKMRVAPVPGTAAEEKPSPLATLSTGRMEAMHATQLEAPADEVTALPVRDFVAAALAGDTLAARGARERFAAAAAPEVTELGSMDAWLHGAAGKAAPASRFYVRSAAPPGGANLTALDALVWPRRQRPEFRQQVEELGRRLVEESAVSPELRPRAQAYAGWLAANATEAASRVEWQRRLESLR